MNSRPGYGEVREGPIVTLQPRPTAVSTDCDGQRDDLRSLDNQPRLPSFLNDHYCWAYVSAGVLGPN